MAIHNALIAVDFDGTVVTHAYPKSGTMQARLPYSKNSPTTDAAVLYTMRSGALLDKAVKWFRDREIPLYAINENPSQQRWTSSPKIHADLYIDDSNLGCPIRFVDGVKRPVADWTKDPGAAGTGGISWTDRPAAQVVRRRATGSQQLLTKDKNRTFRSPVFLFCRNG